MRKGLLLLCLVFILSGCTSRDESLQRAMTLRQRLLDCKQCSFDAMITADYSDVIYTFGMSCIADQSGDVSFTVTSPETISGITGTFTQDNGFLTFDGQALAFAKLAEGQVTPVSAPWLLLHTLRGGYISAAREDAEGLYLMINDSYEEDALLLDIWTDRNDLPVSAEILWKGRRIVSLQISNFTIV